ncbi:hypothetical protein D3C85_1056140 [compost metagenome]
MRGGIVALRIFVDGVLVLVALLKLGFDAVFLEGAPQEEAVAGQAHGLEAGGVLQPQLVGAGSDHIAGDHRAQGHETLAMGDDGLARGAEPVDRLTHFVGGGGGHAALRRADQQHLDAGVLLGLGQGVDDVDHRQARTAESGERIGRLLIGQPFAQVQLQHRVGGRGRLGGSGRRREEQQGRNRQDDEEGHEPGEDAEHGQEELFHEKGGRPVSGHARPAASIKRGWWPSNEGAVMKREKGPPSPAGPPLVFVSADQRPMS